MRLGPLTGLVAVVLIAVAFGVGGDTPGVGDSGPQVKLFFQEHDTQQAVSLYLLVLAGVFLVFFAGSLRHHLSESDRHGWLPQVAFAGGILAAAGFWVASGVTLALLDASDEQQVSGPALQAMNAIGTDLFIPFVAGIGVMVLAAGLDTARRGTPLPRWLGWAGIALGVLMCIPWVGFFAFLVSGLWIIAASVLLARRPHVPDPARTPHMPTP
ncbi:hypothetical protein GCM10010394_22740 [Streptomyces crystallinus]|uniref:DUF4386 family protein n=2 Tax=Streptomyces crystallinus TaxID=68191 RepID=A0ABN1FL71_9ACTN